MADILRIKPSYSRLLSRFIWSVHLLALGMIVLLPLPLALLSGLALLILLSLIHCRNTHLLRSNASAITSVEWDGEEEWLLFGVNGSKRRARLLGSSYVQPWLMVLNFICVGKGRGRMNLILMPDALDAESQRRLRVRLKLK